MCVMCVNVDLDGSVDLDEYEYRREGACVCVRVCVRVCAWTSVTFPA